MVIHSELTMIDIDIDGPKENIIVAYRELDGYIDMCDANVFLDWWNEECPEYAGLSYDQNLCDFHYVERSDYIKFYNFQIELLNKKAVA